MSPALDADLDRLAEALVRLLADWWRRQVTQRDEAVPDPGAARAAAGTHAHAAPGMPATRGRTIAERSERGWRDD